MLNQDDPEGLFLSSAELQRKKGKTDFNFIQCHGI